MLPQRDLSLFWGYYSSPEGYNGGFQSPIFVELYGTLSSMGLAIATILRVWGGVLWRGVIILLC